MTFPLLRPHASDVAYPPVSIGEAARRTGLTPRAIRLYEQHGLIHPPRDRNEVRAYDRDILERLEHIAVFRRADLSLKNIAALLAVLDTSGLAAMRKRLAAMLAEQDALLAARRREIERLRQQLA